MYTLPNGEKVTEFNEKISKAQLTSYLLKLKQEVEATELNYHKYSETKTNISKIGYEKSYASMTSSLSGLKNINFSKNEIRYIQREIQGYVY